MKELYSSLSSIKKGELLLKLSNMQIREKDKLLESNIRCVISSKMGCYNCIFSEGESTHANVCEFKTSCMGKYRKDRQSVVFIRTK